MSTSFMSLLKVWAKDKV